MTIGAPASQGATPAPAPLAMPTQALDRAPAVAFAPTRARTTLARLVAFGGAAALTIYGFVQMRLVFGNETQTFLQGALLVFFTVTFGWIALSATQAVAGLLWWPRREAAPAPPAPVRGRVALVMPVYNESPAETCGALLAMGRALAATGEGGRFEIFILSDTRDPEVWLRETACYARLRALLPPEIAAWYRRRADNSAKKAGNLHQFVETWGGRYDYMLVLDADSLMTAEVMVEMARRMDRAPTLGILQSVPMLAFGETLFARLQQFAGRLYGPVIARGVAAWQGRDGNYWGHNAMIRVRAFAENCGLPVLPGRKPFGGHVMSHDFVEAALIRRGGWDVRMDPDLRGSYEGAPPSLLDVAQRDRRWAQGNLQHAKILGARGLRWPNRAHFLIGIGAYVMSPIWLGMLLVGLTLTAQTLLFQPRYFPDARQLFPNWPVFDAARMTYLFILAMSLLLLPKAVGLARALAFSETRKRFGGAFRVTVGALAEILLSALYAPILMLMQARQVIEILLGRDSGWSAQSRAGGAIPWRVAWSRHWHHVLAGAIPGGLLLWLAPDQAIWISPVVAGLIVAPLLSRLSGDVRAGRALARLGLLTIPEERDPPAAFGEADAARAAFEEPASVSLADLARDPALRESHLFTLGDAAPSGEAAQLAAITARAKIEAAGSPEQAVRWLDGQERAALLATPDLVRLFRWEPGGAGLSRLAAGKA